ncbi:uncharacterized protein LOC130722334 isoform X2 [Lotus japonicus]|uniref:uncharacterized protein LOC130722334 isoform X2 n=1 Tax=Lotus japonicus TaxID=34305 RepID=UPI002585B82E|nr:uncharacterized protein LOC130722334 isoform X2 [Lotus japonicus]
MAFFPPLVPTLLLLVLLLPPLSQPSHGRGISEDNCGELVVQSQCSQNPKCSWCTSEDLDDMCFSQSEAWRLPHQVYSCSFIRPRVDITTGESMALQWPLELVLKHGFMGLQVETDSLTVANSYLSGKGLPELHLLIEDCHLMAIHMRISSSSHVFTKQNCVAHYLANLARSSSVWVGNVPPHILDVAKSDFFSYIIL